MLSGKKHAYFCVLSFMFELFDLAHELRFYIFPLGGKFGKRPQIIRIPCQFGIQLNVLIKAASRLKNLLRLFLVIPEFRPGYFFFQLENLCTFAFRIKDTL